MAQATNKTKSTNGHTKTQTEAIRAFSGSGSPKTLEECLKRIEVEMGDISWCSVEIFRSQQLVKLARSVTEAVVSPCDCECNPLTEPDLYALVQRLDVLLEAQGNFFDLGSVDLKGAVGRLEVLLSSLEGFVRSGSK